MGLFSVRGRLPQPAGYKSPVDSERSLPDVAPRIGAIPARLGLAARAAIRNTARKVAAGLRPAPLGGIAATHDPPAVAGLLLPAPPRPRLGMSTRFPRLSGCFVPPLARY